MNKGDKEYFYSLNGLRGLSIITDINLNDLKEELKLLYTGINNLTILYRIDAIAFGCLIAFYKNYLIKKINTIYFIISLFMRK